MKAKLARLDADKIARPLTRLVGHANPGHCQGPGITVPDALEDMETGARVSLQMKSLEKGVLAGLVKMLENKKYPVADWKREVANDETVLGYAEWVIFREG